MNLEIVKAAKELGEKAKIAIMIPPVIYGSNPKHRRLTIQFPTTVRFALKNGYAPVVGKGLALESRIHMLDSARAYGTLLHWMEQSSPTEVLKNRYFFCENGEELSWPEVAENVGRTLHEKGLLKDAKPRVVPKEQYDDLFGDFTPAVIGLNSRSRAVRLRELGWEPNGKGIWQSWEEDELPELSKEEDRGKSSAYTGVAVK